MWISAIYKQVGLNNRHFDLHLLLPPYYHKNRRTLSLHTIGHLSNSYSHNNHSHGIFHKGQRLEGQLIFRFSVKLIFKHTPH